MVSNALAGRLISIVLAVAFCAGCTESGAPQDGFSNITGTVFTPLDGAVVDVYRPQDDIRGPPFTQLGPLGNEGSFTIDLPPGEYILVARKRLNGDDTGPVIDGDSKSDPTRIVVEPGKDVEIMLPAYVKRGNPKESIGEEKLWSAKLSGRILDPEGKPLLGLRVHVYDHVQMSERPKHVSAKTGPDGRYEVGLPEGGTYYLCARDKYGGPPKVGDLYGRYDKGTVDPSAVIVKDGESLDQVDITVHTVW